jgi:phenylalanine-4-hydroxylase
MQKQEYDAYTSEDHEVWGWLYKEQMQNLPTLAAEAYLHGIKTVKFVPDRVPRFSVINEALAEITG